MNMRNKIIEFEHEVSIFFFLRIQMQMKVILDIKKACIR